LGIISSAQPSSALGPSLPPSYRLGLDAQTGAESKFKEDRSAGNLEVRDEDEIGDRMQTGTRWYHFISYFFGGAFLANTIPHLVNGISGSPFQSPFASPPGEGLSSSTVNVLWGTFNLVVAYLLVVRVGRFELRHTWHMVVLGLGALLMALALAHGFGRFHGGNL
jgi:hypothetical protein